MQVLECEGRGEIWIRGHNVFCGYYQLEDKTQEALTDDGWIKTGDIGLWLVQLQQS
jgi:long-chain acyl-CoA synthetase